MKITFQHIRHLIVVAGVVSIFSGCQNKTGLLDYNSGPRPSYSTPYIYTQDTQVVAYLTLGGIGGTPTGSTTVFNPNVGNVQTGAPGQTNTGGVVTNGTVGANNCLLKIASVSPSGFYNGSSQNFSSVYHNTGYPGGGQIAFPTGAKFPVSCDRESEVAATASAFYATGGVNSQFLWVYKTDSVGASYGQPYSLTIGSSTKIAASPSGHIAVVTNGGKTLTLMYEGRIGGDGGWIADRYHEIPFGNETIQDVVIDDVQGGLYVGTKYMNGAGRVYVFNLHEAFNGRFNPYLDSQTYHNTSYGFPDGTAADFLFRYANPVKIKNFDGLTGVFTTEGHPMFMKTILSLNSSTLKETKSTEELDQVFQDQRDQATVSEIRIFDPFMLTQGYDQNVQARYKDLAIGNNIAYMISDTTLYTIPVSEYDPTTPLTPWITRLNMGRLNTIEMSYDRTFAMITTSSGLSIGRVSGNNLIFNTLGRPDIQDSEVFAAASLAKVYDVKMAPPQDATASASAETSEEK